MYLLMCLPRHLPTRLPTYLPKYLLTYRPVYLLSHLPTYRPVRLLNLLAAVGIFILVKSLRISVLAVPIMTVHHLPNSGKGANRMFWMLNVKRKVNVRRMTAVRKEKNAAVQIQPTRVMVQVMHSQKANATIKFLSPVLSINMHVRNKMENSVKYQIAVLMHLLLYHPLYHPLQTNVKKKYKTSSHKTTGEKKGFYFMFKPIIF